MGDLRGRLLAVLIAVVLAFGMIAGASAQSSYPTAGGARVDGKVDMCIDGNGNAGACSGPSASGPISATGGSVNFAVSGQCTVGISVTGTWSGALTIKTAVDAFSLGLASANYQTTTGVALSTGAVSSAITANGIYQVNVSGFSAIQVFGTNIVSGTANVVMLGGGIGCSNVMADNPVPIAQPTGITPTDHTITSASGSSQTIMAANTSRHSMTIENTGNANCGVNPTGGTAAIGGAGTITLAPLGAYTPRVPSLSAVTVICTAGQPIYGDDN